MARLAAERDCGLVAMHMIGTPQTMQLSPRYEDVVGEVTASLSERLRILENAGIAPERIVLDPGFGFGKTLEHNLSLLRHLPSLGISGRPLLVGVSRKSMIARVLGRDDMAARSWPTVALTAWAREHGARIVRVHEVRQNRDAMRMMEAILHPD